MKLKYFQFQIFTQVLNILTNIQKNVRSQEEHNAVVGCVRKVHFKDGTSLAILVTNGITLEIKKGFVIVWVFIYGLDLAFVVCKQTALVLGKYDLTVAPFFNALNEDLLPNHERDAKREKDARGEINEA